MAVDQLWLSISISANTLDITKSAPHPKHFLGRFNHNYGDAASDNRDNVYGDDL